ncbi:MAG: HAD family hydrolase [Cyanobacteria bacterium J06642_3]
MKPLTKTALTSIGLIATDMDGTLTKTGKFTSELLAALEDLVANHLPVLIVTGRSAGWVSAIANYLPIYGAIAENGGLFYNSKKNQTEFIARIEDLSHYRQTLQTTFLKLQKRFPEIQESSDNRFRITDWTFDIGNLTPTQLKKIELICQEQGFGFTYSTIQCHIKPLQQDKAGALMQLLQSHFPQLAPRQVLTVGDSPNDESLFNPNYFPLSVGVANISHYSDRLKYLPSYITNQPEIQGFCQIRDYLIFSANN